MKKNRELLLRINVNDIFTYSPAGRLFLDGKQLMEGEIMSLQAEIKFLEETRIWKIYQNTLSYRAKEKMFEKAESFDDMRWGKTMLSNLEVLRDINKIVKSWKPIQIKK
jgi:hypothetical protein